MSLKTTNTITSFRCLSANAGVIITGSKPYKLGVVIIQPARITKRLEIRIGIKQNTFVLIVIDTLFNSTGIGVYYKPYAAKVFPHGKGVSISKNNTSLQFAATK